MRNPDESYFKRDVTQKQVLSAESNTGSLLTFPRKPEANDSLLTQRAAIRAGLNQRLLYRLADEGKIRTVVVGRRTLYLASNVLEQKAIIDRSCEWPLAA